MSYHTQQNVQQKSLGFFFVIAFHTLLIGGLISGLSGGKNPETTHPDPIQFIQEKNTPIPLPIFKDPDFSQPQQPIIKPLAQPLTVIEFPSSETINLIAPETNVIVEQVSTVTKPKLINPSRPEYPMTSRHLGEEGTTHMKLLVTAKGRVSEVALESTSGSDRLDIAAVKHAQAYWKFSPCTENGVAVACWFHAKFVWRLDEAAR